MSANFSPHFLNVIVKNIPQFLKEFCLWCVWVSEIGTGNNRREGKFPCAADGHMIKVNDPSEWMTFADAAKALQGNPRFKGLGFLLQEDHCIVGIDIDDCIDDDGNIQPSADAIMRGVPEYWEKSPSGRGLHGYVRAQLPSGTATKFMAGGVRVEVYDHGRYLTVTGHQMQSSIDDVVESQHAIDVLLKRYGLSGSSQQSCDLSDEWPLASIDPIVDGCAFIRHVRDDARTLSEPDWYCGLSILGRCENGEALAHEWSRPYPNYTPEETAGKLRQAVDKSGPITCEYVLTGLGHGNLCASCPSRGRVRSPISLGRPRPGVSTAKPEWPEPQPLDGRLRAVPEFDLRLLPARMQPFALDVAERMRVPLDFLGASLLVATAGVAGRRCRIVPKKFDYKWIEQGNLWGGIVCSTGTMKSAAINTVIEILQSLETQAFEAHRIALGQFERELAMYQVSERQWKDEARRRAADGEEVVPFESTPPQRPLCVRFVVNDSTVAKLQELMAENPQGLLLFRDELAGWLTTLDTKGRESDRPFFLECWTGKHGFTVDRIERGTVRAASLCLSVLGGIQPDVFQRYLLGAIVGGSDNDGLAQRFQILVYPDLPKTPKIVDRVPNESAQAAVEEVFRRIAAIEVDDPFIARFDDDAQACFYLWWEELEHRLRNEAMSEVLRGHLAKYRGLVPKIALLCHLVDDGESRAIPLYQVVRAIEWCRFLEAHARRVYEAASPRSMASILAEKIQSGALGQRFTIREVCKKGWSGLTSTQIVRTRLQELEEADWVRREPVQSSESGGRPAERYFVNPRIPQSRS